MNSVAARSFLLIIGVVSICSWSRHSRAANNENADPAVLYVGPTNEHFDIHYSNSAVNTKNSNGFDGLSASVQFYVKKYLVLASLAEFHQNGPSQQGGGSFNDTEVSLGLGGAYHTNWLKNWHKFAEVRYTNAKTPFFVDFGAGNFGMQMADLNKLSVESDGSYELTERLTAMVGAGLAYGQLDSRGFTSSPNLIGALLRFQLTYQLCPKFFALANLQSEFDTFSYSSFNPQTNGTIKTSLSQTVGTINIGIGYLL